MKMLEEMLCETGGLYRFDAHLVGFMFCVVTARPKHKQGNILLGIEKCTHSMGFGSCCRIIMSNVYFEPLWNGVSD